MVTPSRVRKRFWTPRRWAVVLCGAGALALVIVPVLLIMDWPAYPAPVPHEVKRAGADFPDQVGQTYVFDCWGNFIDSQHLWRVEAGPDVLAALVRDLGVSELKSADEVPAQFWSHSPYWWQPKQTETSRYFMTPKFPIQGRGPDGTHYLMAYDKATGVLYVWHKSNF